MNNNALAVGGIIVIAIIGIGLYLMSQDGGLLGTNATTTISTNTETGGSTTGGQTTPSQPIATTNATVAPTDTTVVVTGTVMPNGAITSYWYEYGTTLTLGSRTREQIVGSGFTAIPTPGYISGLLADTSYYFRLVAKNEFGTVNGEQNAVKTTKGTAAPTVILPIAKTLVASGIASTSATLTGQINPNSESARYWFEYGTTANLGNATAITSVGSGTAVVAASAVATNLSANTKYFYRINTQNQFGTVNGATVTFQTR